MGLPDLQGNGHAVMLDLFTGAFDDASTGSVVEDTTAVIQMLSATILLVEHPTRRWGIRFALGVSINMGVFADGLQSTESWGCINEVVWSYNLVRSLFARRVVRLQSGHHCESVTSRVP